MYDLCNDAKKKLTHTNLKETNEKRKHDNKINMNKNSKLKRNDSPFNDFDLTKTKSPKDKSIQTHLNTNWNV